MKGNHCDSFRFKPHWTDILKPRSIMPAAAGIIFGAASLLRGRVGTAEITVVSVFSAITILTLLSAEVRRRHTSIEIHGGMMTCLSPSRENTIRLREIDRAEILGTCFSGLSGGVRLRVYSNAAHRKWLSVRISNRLADEIVGRTVPLGSETGRIVPGKHSALLYALTSRTITLLLISSGFFTLFSGGSFIGNTVAACLTSCAAIDFFTSFVRFRRLSLLRRENGCIVTAGFLGKRKIFLPQSAVVGAVIMQSPAAVLCGFGALGLMTSGGTVIPCACRVDSSDLMNTAMRLVGAEGNFRTRLSQTEAIRKKYAWGIVPAFTGTVLSVYFAAFAESAASRLLACIAGSLLTIAAVRSLLGFFCADRFGLNASPSVIFAGDVKGCCAEYYLFRRGCVAGVRVSSSLFRRMEGLCCAQPFTSGGRKSVKCSCVLYGALNGFTARFCG